MAPPRRPTKLQAREHLTTTWNIHAGELNFKLGEHLTTSWDSHAGYHDFKLRRIQRLEGTSTPDTTTPSYEEPNDIMGHPRRPS